MVVSDSSPLIYLAALSDFHFLKLLFEKVLVPPAVYEEVVTNGGMHAVVEAVSNACGDWISVQSLSQPHRGEALMEEYGIQAGEAEAIRLACELHPDALLMDDADGVLCAARFGLNVLRTTAVYRIAKRRGIIPAVAPKLDQLRRVGFRLSDTHYDLILRKAGEL